MKDQECRHRRELGVSTDARIPRCEKCSSRLRFALAKDPVYLSLSTRFVQQHAVDRGR